MVTKLFFLLLFVVISDGVDVNNLKLKQVLMIGRHNVRFPLGTKLHRYSSKTWFQREGTAGNLTPRGAYLEGLMGEYFSLWFKNEHFLDTGCPDDDLIHVYANSVNRTIETAKAFLNSAFRGCNVMVHHKNTDKADPLFTPFIHNTTEDYKNKVFDEINKKLSQPNDKLDAAYLELNNILDIQKSDVCKQDAICDMTDKCHNKILYEVGKELWVKGPLFIGNVVLDSFTMSYYDGVPLKDIAWGKITEEKWKLLSEIEKQDQAIRYTIVAENIGLPLVKNITQIFKHYDEKAKLILIVGHDYNMNSILTVLSFKSIELPNQNEQYPIGGKLVFQRWTDGQDDYLKIEYVYASWSQLRHGTKFSLDQPPQRVIMQLNWCNTDMKGFCPWNEFVSKL